MSILDQIKAKLSRKKPDLSPRINPGVYPTDINRFQSAPASTPVMIPPGSKGGQDIPDFLGQRTEQFINTRYPGHSTAAKVAGIGVSTLADPITYLGGGMGGTVASNIYKSRKALQVAKNALYFSISKMNNTNDIYKAVRPWLPKGARNVNDLTLDLLSNSKPSQISKIIENYIANPDNFKQARGKLGKFIKK